MLPRHAVLLALTWVLLVAQRLHLVPAAVRPAAPVGRDRCARRSSPTSFRDGAPVDAYLFPGCVMDAWQRDVHRAALRVMRAAGAPRRTPRSRGDCCGALHTHGGRVGDGAEAGPAGHGVDAGRRAGRRRQRRLRRGDEGLRPAASARRRRTRSRRGSCDFSEWVAAHGPPPLRDTGAVVVVQDPCHLRHVQKAQGAVRTVLAPAYRLEETADDGLCCGAGGAYSVREPELVGPDPRPQGRRAPGRAP